MLPDDWAALSEILQFDRSSQVPRVFSFGIKHVISDLKHLVNVSYSEGEVHVSLKGGRIYK